MKKTVITVLAIFAFLLTALVALPFIFKDKIVEKIDEKISKSVNAQVYYDYKNISFSVFKRFPHISATLSEFGVFGNPPFQNDTLIHVNNLQVDFNLRSILFDDYPTLTGIHLAGGNMYVKILEDGLANYDILVPSDEIEEENDFQMGVDLIEINDLNIIYDDRELDYFMALGNMDLEGSGDFTLDIYDLPIKFETIIADISYEGTNYIQNKLLNGETEMHIDMEQMKFAFGDGEFKLNEFLFDLQGFVALPEDDIEFDLNFEGKDNSFKSVLSLLPGMYTESFSNLNTSGTFEFNGFFKGIYNDTSFPLFDISLNIMEGMFQYPDLAQPVKDVNLAMRIINDTGNLDYTSINIPTFNLNFGNNPISGRLLLKNLITYDIDGLVQGKLNLEELTSIFPIEGIALKGALDVNVAAIGRYDSIENLIPKIDAKLLLNNGYVKSDEYPSPIENLNINASVQNPSGKMADFVVNLAGFGFDLDGESINGTMKINDFAKLNWDGTLKGTVDVGKISAIFPIEDVIMEGKISADLISKGSYDDIEQERFGRLETRGEVQINDFYYTSIDLPQGIRINEAVTNFSPERINLSSFDSRVGESPILATGFLSNYMNYFLQENQTLTGELILQSKKFNLNQWMTNSEEDDDSELTVIELPHNINFNMTVQADEVLYDNLVLTNVKGNLTLQKGVLDFKEASMNTLGGQIVMNGIYDPRNLASPSFDLNFKVNNLSIAEAYNSFNTIKFLAPVAQHLTGNFSTNLGFNGLLGADMMPILSSLNGKGILEVVEAALQNSPILKGISDLTKLSEFNSLQLRNLKVPIDFEDGMLNVRPFNVNLSDYKAEIRGSTGFDGTINYLINMQIPAGKFGSQANQILSAISGSGANTSTLIPLSINLGGTYQNPNVGLAGENSIENLLSNALKSRVSSEKENLQAKVTEQFQAREDSIKEELRIKGEIMRDSAQKVAAQKVGDSKEKAVEEAKNLLKGILGNKPKPVAQPDSLQ